MQLNYAMIEKNTQYSKKVRLVMAIGQLETVRDCDVYYDRLIRYLINNSLP